MVTGRQFLFELLRALCVLGLVFLNLAHVPATAAGEAGVLCGPATDAGQTAGDTEPCPACRLAHAGCVLPPAPPSERVRASVAVTYGIVPGFAQERRDIVLFSATGPPSA